MDDIELAVIGLGYVGLPLCLEFAKKYPTIGFDISQQRINELKNGFDRTNEIEAAALRQVGADVHYTTDVKELVNCNFYIITVPTPIDEFKRPDLGPLLESSKTIGKILKQGDVVIYESTVYPGATEEDCVPILELYSGLKLNKDFYCGYSPERINPGDKSRTVSQIKKVTSGSTPEIAEKIDALYRSVIKAGTHLAPSIKVAEAAKVIENAQRDINIGFVNELAVIFNRLGINTKDVLEAASTKWNFLPFKPGLVGGHCIGVDPYYLTHKAEQTGYYPEIILAARRLNDYMGIYIANQIVKLMITKDLKVSGTKVLVLGVAFKENCPDIRNSKVVDLISELADFGCQIDVYDPWVNADEALAEYGLTLVGDSVLSEMNQYTAIVLAVAHDAFNSLNLKRNKHQVIYDIKSALPESDGSL